MISVDKQVRLFCEDGWKKQRVVGKLLIDDCLKQRY